MAHSAENLGALSKIDGFRLRGLEMTRIETFTDALFAFALTLLVVSLDIPSSYGELTDALRGIPAFALSATLLMVFWSGHHTWSRRISPPPTFPNTLTQTESDETLLDAILLSISLFSGKPQGY
jgi:hypothetical protein